MDIILASSSPRRIELLANIDIDYTSVPSDIDEDEYICDLPENIAMKLALAKAENVANKITEPSLVIGADTLIYKDKIIGKPQDRTDAFKILKDLQGSRHTVLTGLAVIKTTNRRQKVICEKTHIQMSPMTDREILDYISTGEPMDKAGAYAIQGKASIYISKIEGCYYNVVGLPLNKLWKILKEFGIEI